MADPNYPNQLLPTDDSGGHLHPNDTGYHAMTDAADLRALLPASAARAGRRAAPCKVPPSLTPIKAGAPVSVTCDPQPQGFTYDDSSAALNY